MKKYYLLALILSAIFNNATSQTTKHYDIARMLSDNQLIVNPGYSAKVFDEGGKKGITCTGTVWLKDVAFERGIVEFDVRGRNEFFKSFVGIVFNAVDTTKGENICFRPFNFQHHDPGPRGSPVEYPRRPGNPY